MKFSKNKISSTSCSTPIRFSVKNEKSMTLCNARGAMSKRTEVFCDCYRGQIVDDIFIGLVANYINLDDTWMIATCT